MTDNVYLDSLAWIDPETDVVHVRVRQYIRNPNGELCKRGFTFKATAELMKMIPEACKYKYIYPTLDDIQDIIFE